MLRTWKLGETDRIVTFLTREFGKKSGVAKGARVKHSRFGGQLQPLAKVQVTWYEREHSAVLGWRGWACRPRRR